MANNRKQSDLKIANQTLKSVYKQIKLDNQSDIPLIIRLFENPNSLIALPGKISLHDHDCLHILLGLGASPYEEAFLIGFTMGNDDKTRFWHVKFLKFLTKFIYPAKYRFNCEDLNYFDLGFEYGKKLQYPNLNQIEFSHFLGCFTAQAQQPESKSNETSLTISNGLAYNIQTLLAQSECYRTMGPYNSYSQAESERQQLIRAGYSTSEIWGKGGVVSNWSNRRYYFNFFYRC